MSPSPERTPLTAEQVQTILTKPMRPSLYGQYVTREERDQLCDTCEQLRAALAGAEQQNRELEETLRIARGTRKVAEESEARSYERYTHMAQDSFFAQKRAEAAERPLAELRQQIAEVRTWLQSDAPAWTILDGKCVGIRAVLSRLPEAK